MGIAAALRHRRVLRGVASASGGADGRAQRDEPALRPPEQRGVRHGVVYLFVRRKAQHLQRQRERAAEQSRQEEVEMGSLRRGDGDAAVATGRVLTQHLLVVAAEPERALRKQRHGVVRENYEPSSPVPTQLSANIVVPPVPLAIFIKPWMAWRRSSRSQRRFTACDGHSRCAGVAVALTTDICIVWSASMGTASQPHARGGGRVASASARHYR